MFYYAIHAGQIGRCFGGKILDLGCGEGGYSRELARKQAEVVAVDCSKECIDYSEAQAKINDLSIPHYIRNSNDLYDIDDNTFDIVLCSMMLMDCEDLQGTVREAVRVLKPSGKLFASVLHPCFNGNHSDGIGRQGEGLNRQVVVKNYFSPSQWEAPLPQGQTSVIWRHRTFEDYIKVFVKSVLTIIDLNEPHPTEE